MDLIGLLLGMVTAPITWPIALLMFVAIALMKGWIIPRAQSDALISQHEKVENGLRETLTLVREDRDKSLDSLRVERDLWRDVAKDSQEIAGIVRKQNSDLIENQESFDHLIDELRKMTGIGGDKDGG